jgi:hypothetical protein
MGEGLSDTTIRRSRPPATAKGCSTTPISRTPSHHVRTPQEANGRTDFVALLTKRSGAQATLVAFGLLRSAGIRMWIAGTIRPPALTRNAGRSNLKPALLNFPAQETRQEARDPRLLIAAGGFDFA